MNCGSCHRITKRCGSSLMRRDRLVCLVHLIYLFDGGNCLNLSHTAAELPQISEVLQSTNSLAPQEPFRIPLGSDELSLEPEEDINLSLHLHAEQFGEHDLSVLLVFREVCRHSVFAISMFAPV